jgi:hypothetical protein
VLKTACHFTGDLKRAVNLAIKRPRYPATANEGSPKSIDNRHQENEISAPSQVLAAKGVTTQSTAAETYTIKVESRKISINTQAGIPNASEMESRTFHGQFFLSTIMNKKLRYGRLSPSGTDFCQL